MRVFSAALGVAGMLLISLPSVASIHPHHHTSAHPIVRRANTTRSARHAEHSFFAERPGITTERATEIQTALIRQGYLTGEPTGTWDSASVAAMQKLQSDNGWQTKLIPDSRALIKLGLGPNSNSASAAAPAMPGAYLPASN